MEWFLGVVLVLIVGFAVFYIWKEYAQKNKKEKQDLSRGVLKNKKQIANMVANVESILIYADGNDSLCNRLVELKENIKFFNPSIDEKILLTDQKIANKLDDLKILVLKDNTQETCLRMLEEIEAFVVQRTKQERSV